MPSLVAPVAFGDLPTWPTKRLLALRDRLLRCEEALERSDVEDLAEIDPPMIRLKDDARWKPLYEASSAELSTREHVPRGAERKRRRQEDARAARAQDRTPPPKPRAR